MRLSTPAGRAPALALGGLAALGAGAAAASPPLVVVGAGLLALVATAALLAWAAAAVVRPRRTIHPPRCVDGARVEVDLWVATSRAAAAAVWACDVSVRPDQEYPPLVAAEGGHGWWRWVIDAAPRGEHRAGPVRVAVGDPFGLVEWSRAIDPVGDRHLVVEPWSVLPEVVGLADGSQVARGGGGAPAHSGELERVRPYRVGDSLNRVHWGQTAKRGRLQAKQMRRGRDPWAVVEVVLDGAAITPAAYELAVSTAASLMRFAEQAALAAGLTVTGPTGGRLAPGHHPWARSAGILARAQPGVGEWRQLDPGADGCIVVVTAGAPEPWAEHLGPLVGRVGLLVIAVGATAVPRSVAGAIEWRSLDDHRDIASVLAGEDRVPHAA